MKAERKPTIRHQRGVVLFIALIVMVAMSLAAIALIRSVDTTNILIGNLAFRQSSILPSEHSGRAGRRCPVRRCRDWRRTGNRQ